MSKLRKYDSLEEQFVEETVQQFFKENNKTLPIKLKPYLIRMLLSYKGAQIHQKLEENLTGMTIPMTLMKATPSELKSELERRGYYAKTLFSDTDVSCLLQDMSTESALEILDEVFNDDALTHVINQTVVIVGVNKGFKPEPA